MLSKFILKYSHIQIKIINFYKKNVNDTNFIFNYSKKLC